MVEIINEVDLESLLKKIYQLEINPERGSIAKFRKHMREGRKILTDMKKIVLTVDSNPRSGMHEINYLDLRLNLDTIFDEETEFQLLFMNDMQTRLILEYLKLKVLTLVNNNAPSMEIQINVCDGVIHDDLGFEPPLVYLRFDNPLEHSGYEQEDAKKLYDMCILELKLVEEVFAQVIQEAKEYLSSYVK